MNVLSSVLERLRSKRTEQTKSVWSQYHLLVRKLASDEQCDIDELALCMDQLDKSDGDLEHDISQQRERVTLAAMHSEYLRLQDEIPALERTHEKAKQAYNAAVSKLQPQVTTAFDKWNAAHHQMLALTSAEGRLLESCRDPELLDEKNRIHEQRQLIATDLRALTNESPVANYESLRTKLQKLYRDKSAMTRENSPSLWRVCVADIERVEGSVAEFKKLVDEFNKKKADLQKQLSDLDRQSAELNKKMLVP